MNDRLQIAAIMMAKMYNELTDVLEPSHLADEALDYADALIAAAGEGGMSEKPTSHSEPIKSDWSLKESLITLRRDDGKSLEPALSDKQVSEICYLVEKFYKPSVPSVEEIEEVLKNVCNTPGFPTIGSFSESLHQWLTERAKQ